jgi:hypothetical protein
LRFLGGGVLVVRWMYGVCAWRGFHGRLDVKVEGQNVLYERR